MCDIHIMTDLPSLSLKIFQCNQCHTTGFKAMTPRQGLDAPREIPSSLKEEYTCQPKIFLENSLRYKSQPGNEYKSRVTSPTETVFLILLQLSKHSKIEGKIKTCYAKDQKIFTEAQHEETSLMSLSPQPLHWQNSWLIAKTQTMGPWSGFCPAQRMSWWNILLFRSNRQWDRLPKDALINHCWCCQTRGMVRNVVGAWKLQIGGEKQRSAFCPEYEATNWQPVTWQRCDRRASFHVWDSRRSCTASGKKELCLKTRQNKTKTHKKNSVFLMFVWYSEAGNCSKCQILCSLMCKTVTNAITFCHTEALGMQIQRDATNNHKIKIKMEKKKKKKEREQNPSSHFSADVPSDGWLTFYHHSQHHSTPAPPRLHPRDP